ncbi:MAG: hypothetical protein FJY82_07535 [Candidatus Aminicenantes bacterium]|nr:hypothetical protein [Candidatus Aminicenantes bacterium]
MTKRWILLAAGALVLAAAAYSDFATTALPGEPVKKEAIDGKTVFRRAGFTGVRVGKGGPEIRCDTLNGDIFIKKNG